MARYDSVFVRVWRSDVEDGEQWSGQLQHFQSEGVRHFTHPDALLSHLRTLVCLSGPPGAVRRAAPRAEPRDDGGNER